MKFILRHWKPIRRIAVLIAVSSAVSAVIIPHLFIPGDAWAHGIFLAFACLIAAFLAYSFPFLARASSSINHRLFNSMNPRSTWFQTVLFWLSLIATTGIIGLALPSELEFHDRILGSAVGLCANLGLLIGCGDFFVRERPGISGLQQTEETPDIPN